MLVVLGGPAVATCADDPRGIVTCLRGMVGQRFDLEGLPPATSPQLPAALPEPTTAPARAIVAAVPQPMPAEISGEAAGSAATPDPIVAGAIAVAAPVPPISLDPGTSVTGGLGLLATASGAATIVPLPPPPPASPPEPVEIATSLRVALGLEFRSLAHLSVSPARPAAFDATLLRLALRPLAGASLGARVTAAAAMTMPALPPPLAETPAPVAVAVAPDLELASIGPDPSGPETEVVKLPVPAPTIDAVEIDADHAFIAGDGPPGALMRLYVDGVAVGESEVEAGRWLVDVTGIFDKPRQVLRVEAISLETGRLLGSASVSFEIELPEQPAPETPPAEPEASAPAPAEPLPRPVEDPVAEATVPQPLPALVAAVPAGETASVSILPAPDTASVQSLDVPAEAPSVLVLPPTSPALLANFTLPPPPAARIATIRAWPLGDPDLHRFTSGKAIIRRGDTLWAIARRYYGHGIHFRTIVHANRPLIARPSRIFPGQVFELPLVYDE